MTSNDEKQTSGSQQKSTFLRTVEFTALHSLTAQDNSHGKAFGPVSHWQGLSLVCVLTFEVFDDRTYFEEQQLIGWFGHIRVVVLWNAFGVEDMVYLGLSFLVSKVQVMIEIP